MKYTTAFKIFFPWYNSSVYTKENLSPQNFRVFRKNKQTKKSKKLQRNFYY